MQTALILMNLIIIWIISLSLAFMGGFYYSIKKRAAQKPKALQSENKALTEEEKKEQREYENFLSYSGKPQEGINE